MHAQYLIVSIFHCSPCGFFMRSMCGWLGVDALCGCVAIHVWILLEGSQFVHFHYSHCEFPHNDLRDELIVCCSDPSDGLDTKCGCLGFGQLVPMVHQWPFKRSFSSCRNLVQAYFWHGRQVRFRDARCFVFMCLLTLHAVYH